MNQLASTLSSLVSQFMKEKAGGLDFAFLGHSLGSAICFEVAKHVLKEGQVSSRLKHLFLCASKSPSVSYTLTTKRPIDLTAEEVKQVLERLGGTPKEILENKEMMEIISPYIQSDFQLSYDYKYDGTVLEVPTTYIGGKKDGISLEAQQSWKECFSSSFQLHWIDEDHFFITKKEDQLLQIVKQVLEKL